MIICVLQRTNNSKICSTRTTHGKIITMIRVSCLSCPRHESNCQSGHYLLLLPHKARIKQQLWFGKKRARKRMLACSLLFMT